MKNSILVIWAIFVASYAHSSVWQLSAGAGLGWSQQQSVAGSNLEPDNYNFDFAVGLGKTSSGVTYSQLSLFYAGRNLGLVGDIDYGMKRLEAPFELGLSLGLMNIFGGVYGAYGLGELSLSGVGVDYDAALISRFDWGLSLGLAFSLAPMTKLYFRYLHGMQDLYTETSDAGIFFRSLNAGLALYF